MYIDDIYFVVLACLKQTDSNHREFNIGGKNKMDKGFVSAQWDPLQGCSQIGVTGVETDKFLNMNH